MNNQCPLCRWKVYHSNDYYPARKKDGSVVYILISRSFCGRRQCSWKSVESYDQKVKSLGYLPYYDK